MTGLRAGTVCSGIGAPECAMPHWNWRWCAEIERFASAVLKARFPHVPNLGDFTEIGADADAIDVLVGGTPCQSFSIAGRRAGLDDPRGNLALEFLALARRLRPAWLVFENVPGLLSSDEGRDFGAFLGAMGKCGYGFAYRVLDAQHWGVAQRRRRVFVVGYLGDWRPPAAVLFERESLRGDTSARGEAREGVARPLGAGSARGSGYRNDADTAENLIAHTLNAKGGSGKIDGKSETFVSVFSAKDAGLSGVRRLTPVECERLMGLPDDWTLIEHRAKPAADGPRYKAIGNSMAVPVVRWILSRLEQVDEIMREPTA